VGRGAYQVPHRVHFAAPAEGALVAVDGIAQELQRHAHLGLADRIPVRNHEAAAALARDPDTILDRVDSGHVGGIARIEKRSSGAKESASPRKEKVAPTTSVAGDGTAHFAPPQSAGDDRLRLIAIALVAALALLAMILVRRPASRALQDMAGALPMETIVLTASLIFVSVLVGLSVVLIIGPALGP